MFNVMICFNWGRTAIWIVTTESKCKNRLTAFRRQTNAFIQQVWIFTGVQCFWAVLKCLSALERGNFVLKVVVPFIIHFLTVLSQNRGRDSVFPELLGLNCLSIEGWILSITSVWYHISYFQMQLFITFKFCGHQKHSHLKAIIH